MHAPPPRPLKKLAFFMRKSTISDFSDEYPRQGISVCTNCHILYYSYMKMNSCCPSNTQGEKMRQTNQKLMLEPIDARASSPRARSFRKLDPLLSLLFFPSAGYMKFFVLRSTKRKKKIVTPIIKSWLEKMECFFLLKITPACASPFCFPTGTLHF